VLWFFFMFAAVMGIYMDRELAHFVELSASEIRLVLTGVLVGLGVAFFIGELDSRMTAERRRW
jgi:hypothetical protein